MNAKGFSWKKFWSDMGNRKFIFLLAVGLILAMLVFPASSSEEGIRETETQPAVQDAQSAQSYAAELENRLEEVLSTIEGAGRVEVMVTISASSEQVLDVYKRQGNTRSGGDGRNDGISGNRKQRGGKCTDENERRSGRQHLYGDPGE